MTGLTSRVKVPPLPCLLRPGTRVLASGRSFRLSLRSRFPAVPTRPTLPGAFSATSCRPLGIAAWVCARSLLASAFFAQTKAWDHACLVKEFACSWDRFLSNWLRKVSNRNCVRQALPEIARLMALDPTTALRTVTSGRPPEASRGLARSLTAQGQGRPKQFL